MTALNEHFQGLDSFPLVTLEQLEPEGLLKARQLQFLKDRRVTFIPFASVDPDDQVVIVVGLKRGFFTETTELTERKESITSVPK